MAENNKYIKLIAENRNLAMLEKIMPRKESKALYESMGSKPLKIISGFRRSGKSTLAKLCLQELVKNQIIKLENILYLNFEDFELAEIINAHKLAEVYETFINFISIPGQKLLIFDEIQKVKDWDKFIRTLYEKNIHNDQIILTGSNSDMLSSDLGSNLAGRFIEFKLQPFSFEEFLSYRSISLPQNLDRKKFISIYPKLEEEFYEYLREGGLPEIYQISNPNTKLSYAQSIISKVILDDIVNRFNLRNNIAISKIFQFISQNPGKIIVFSKLVKYLKQIGVGLHQETLIEYISYLEKAFAIYQVDKFDYSTKKIFQGSKKFYLIDIGLAHLYKGITNNFSMILENIVFLKLKRDINIKNIFYIDGNDFEIDFITEDWQGKFTKYQVTQKLSEENFDRELKGFISVDEYLKKSPSILLNLDDLSKVIEYKGHKIEQKNLIEFLISD